MKLYRRVKFDSPDGLVHSIRDLAKSEHAAMDAFTDWDKFDVYEYTRRNYEGERVPAEAYLRLFPALESDPEGAVELAYGEFLLREQAGERPSLEEYQWRFPALRRSAASSGVSSRP